MPRKVARALGWRLDRIGIVSLVINFASIDDTGAQDESTMAGISFLARLLFRIRTVDVNVPAGSTIAKWPGCEPQVTWYEL